MAKRDETSIDISVPRDLPVEDRARVQAALKRTLESELADIAANEGSAREDLASEHTRESGPFHTSGHDKSSSSLAEFGLISEVTAMDEAQFGEFSRRLASLKSQTQSE